MTTIHLKRSPINWAALIEGCLLAGLGAMLLRKTWDDQLALYIHPRYSPLVLATSLLIIVIGAFRLWQTGEPAQSLRGRGVIYGLLLAPLLLGVLIPGAPAGSALIDPRQINSVRPGYTTIDMLPNDDSTSWNLLDWMFARYTLKPEEAQDKPVDVVGFVYRDPTQPQAADEFYVVRYTLACCVADRTSTSLPVKWPESASLPSDQWVRVTGKIRVRPGDGPLDLIVAEAHVEPIEQPDEPYLYP